LIERVADSFGDFRSGGKLDQSFFEPDFQGFDERPGFLLPDSLALIGAPAADLGFDLVELRDPPQGLGGDWCRCCFCQVEELSPAVRPAISEADRTTAALGVGKAA